MMKLKYIDGVIKNDDGDVLDCPILKIQKALGLRDMEIKRDKNGQSVISAILSEVDKVDSDYDVIKEGAFDNSIKELSHLQMLKMHQRGDIVGRWSDIKMDGKHLVATGVLYDGDKGYDMAKMTRTLIDSGDLKGVSIGFRPKVWTNVKDENRPYGWDIHDLELREASIVDVPANDSAKVTEVKMKLAGKLDAIARQNSVEETFLKFLEDNPQFKR